ncbi:hypothetical protein P152DRAFT_453407 [Eremomyces bilateralis CBS 781.70]|uniref:Large ribosomal subunit protein uL23m n=1 Tax=Eremomyces bilateralis CBS 781.70 TaxID=1392243 RepID=A0A6G1GFT5_9PEZI|nr:uncharacterized protein P152DRAFT_453407 [Eremomyces bilateralis CBS 781.70]KAF1816786.1 hypothetical protein P152DRAFT_453407 [Eremomyces bilateralis CBS 781.70]
MREKLDPNYQAEQEALRAAREQAKADADAERLRAKLESIGIPEAPFFMGQKEVYLPNIRIALLKTPQHPPSFAKFLVPLTWNKLDLRDYLWNVYGVHAVRVRVYVQLQRVRMDKPREKYPAARRWFRPQSKKFMTIEMDEPFYWPPDPEDFVEWDKDTFDAANKTKIKERDSRMPIGAMEKPAGAADLRALAKKFVTGSEKWTPPTDPFGLDRHLKK